MPYRKLLKSVDRHLKNKQDRKLKSLLVKKDFHVTAHVIDHLETGRVKIFGLLPPEIQAEVALVLHDSTKRFIFPRLSDFTIARMLHFNDEDDAVDILQFLPNLRRKHIIEKLKEDKKKKVERLLRYHPESAGGLMDMNFILVKPDFSLKDVATKVQKHSERTKQAPLIIVVNEETETIGYIPYKNLIFRSASATVKSLTQSLTTISYSADQEKVLEHLLKERGEVVGVIDKDKQILGIIHARDLIRVVQDEATEDVYRFAGVSSEEDAIDTAHEAVRRRYKWLLINLGTALMAAFVVSLFQGSIAQMAILAVYMPIVAGMGGNAGTQTLAVVVRGIALGEVSWDNGRKIISKEMQAGFMNGIIVGLVATGVSILLSQPPLLGIVLGASIMINMGMAGLFGALTPITLKAFNVDPAVASAVFVTTVTDIFGFLTFLGLATIVLL